MVREEDLDLVLVPLGLAVVAGYHVWLLYAILRHPTRTVVGLNALARKRWVAVIMAVEHGEERGAGRADAAEQHHGVDGAGHDGHHARLRHQRLHRRHGGPLPGVALALLVAVAAAGVREHDGAGVRGQVPGHLALLHARLRVQRAGHPAVRARQLPAGPAAGRGRGGGVRGVRGAHGEPRQPRLVAGPPRLLRLAGALHVDLRAHPDARVQRPHVRAALLPRHHHRLRQGDTAHAYARPWRKGRTQRWHRLSFAGIGCPPKPGRRCDDLLLSWYRDQWQKRRHTAGIQTVGGRGVSAPVTVLPERLHANTPEQLDAGDHRELRATTATPAADELRFAAAMPGQATTACGDPKLLPWRSTSAMRCCT